MEMNNERRADLGEVAVMAAATTTGVARAEDAETAVVDVLAYVAHFCDRLGLDAQTMFGHGLRSYHGDEEDGPLARTELPADEPLLRPFESDS